MLSIIFSIVSALFLLKIEKHKKYNRIKTVQLENICKFVNLLNSTMMQTYEVTKAYEMIEIQLPIDFANMCESDFYYQLDELASSYQSLGFKMYVNDLKIYNDNDINFHQLVNSSTSICLKEKIDKDKLNKRKYMYLTQINYLYVLWIVLLTFIKIFVTDYYSLMVSHFLYQLLMFIVLLLAVVFYYLAYKEYLK